jgi:hypothetical protein
MKTPLWIVFSIIPVGGLVSSLGISRFQKSVDHTHQKVVLTHRARSSLFSYQEKIMSYTASLQMKRFILSLKLKVNVSFVVYERGDSLLTL